MGRLKWNMRVEASSAAAPAAVWAVVSDVTRVGEWSHECKRGEWIDGATEAVPGARFRGANETGRNKWERQNEIVEADEPHRLVWRTVMTRLYRDQTEWCITLEPDGSGTRIIQTYEVLRLNPFLERLFYVIVPEHRDRTEALQGDLQRLAEVAAGAIPHHA